MRVRITYRKRDRNGVYEGARTMEMGCSHWAVEHGALTVYSAELSPKGFDYLPKVSWPLGEWIHIERIHTPPGVYQDDHDNP